MTKDSYVTILGWMSSLDLKPNELLIYAIIYGFSQDKESYFYGSIDYLTKWTHTTPECVSYLLKELVEKGLLEKISREGKTSLYRAINPFETEVVEVKEVKPKEPKEDSVYKTSIENIINYLNAKLGTRYRQSSATNKLIISKLKAGFSESDFYTVIDKKYNDWFNDSEFSKYLRPSTLFGNKFENYLNQPTFTYKYNNNYSNNSSVSNQIPNVNTSIIY